MILSCNTATILATNSGKFGKLSTLREIVLAVEEGYPVQDPERESWDPLDGELTENSTAAATFPSRVIPRRHRHRHLLLPLP